MENAAFHATQIRIVPVGGGFEVLDARGALLGRGRSLKIAHGIKDRAIRELVNEDKREVDELRASARGWLGRHARAEG